MYTCIYIYIYIYITSCCLIVAVCVRHRMRDMMHSHVCHDAFICVTWHIHIMCAWHDLCMCVTWLIHMRDTTHSHAQHDSFICATWLIHMCDMTHSHAQPDSFPCATGLIYSQDLTVSHVQHDSFTCSTWLNCTCDMTHVLPHRLLHILRHCRTPHNKTRARIRILPPMMPRCRPGMPSDPHPPPSHPPSTNYIICMGAILLSESVFWNLTQRPLGWGGVTLCGSASW